jgi:2-iminobutanoate/2-iminopropanoate deaminase
MQRLRVEPISTYLERRRKGTVYPVTIANGLVFLSGLPPFDPQTGDIAQAPFERQVEIVLMQMKHCLAAAGSSLLQVLKCNVYCTPNPEHFAKFNEVYARYFPAEAPARIFLHVPSFFGPFDVEIDCIATLG